MKLRDIERWNEVITSNILIGTVFCITFYTHQPLWLQSIFAFGICLYAGDEIILDKIFRQTTIPKYRGRRWTI